MHSGGNMELLDSVKEGEGKIGIVAESIIKSKRIFFDYCRDCAEYPCHKSFTKPGTKNRVRNWFKFARKCKYLSQAYDDENKRWLVCYKNPRYELKEMDSQSEMKL